MAGELANYATSSSVTSATSSALSSYDNSSQVDSKIITALLDFYTRTEVDQQITNAPGERGSLELLHASRDAELRGQRAARVLPSDRAGFAVDDSDPHPVLDVGANPNGDRRRHRRRGLPHPSAGRRPVLRGQRQRELRVPGAHQRHASPNQGPSAPGAPGGQHHPHGNHARAHLRRLFESGVPTGGT